MNHLQMFIRKVLPTPSRLTFNSILPIICQLVFSHFRLDFSKTCLKKTFKTLWPLFMDAVQLSQGYRATTRRQFTFYHLVPRSFWYSFDRPLKDERLSQP